MPKGMEEWNSASNRFVKGEQDFKFYLRSINKALDGGLHGALAIYEGNLRFFMASSKRQLDAELQRSTKASAVVNLVLSKVNTGFSEDEDYAIAQYIAEECMKDARILVDKLFLHVEARNIEGAIEELKFDWEEGFTKHTRVANTSIATVD